MKTILLMFSNVKTRLPILAVIMTFFLGFFSLLLSSWAVPNPGPEEIIITGLRFDKERTEAFKKIPKQPAFTIDNKGILRPTKDYQILLVKADKVLVLLPKTTTYSAYKQLDGYEEITLPGGALIGCMCNGRDDCYFDNSKKEYEFECTGTCDCYIGVLFNYSNPPFQYETPGGQWFNF